MITTEHRFKKLLPPSTPTVTRHITVLDTRKRVAARNEFVDVVDGCVEATLFSSLSTTDTTQIRYIHIPFSSEHSESNKYHTLCESARDVRMRYL